MKRICTLLLAAGLVFGAATGASAIDFKAKGEWLMGFGVGDTSPLKYSRDNGQPSQKENTEDVFDARQRVRLQLDAVASEALSGTVYFEIGDQLWGQNASGAALGADGRVVEVKRAYIDWIVPQTDLKFRMGIQGVVLPNVAGGSAIMDDDVAGITASYQFNENVGLTALWARPFNDNFGGLPRGVRQGNAYGNSNYLDNVDLFALMLPIKLDGFAVTPWAMYGIIGHNAFSGDPKGNDYGPAFVPYDLPANEEGLGHTGKAYGSAFWAGLPLSVTAWDPLNIELDINYGYVEAMGRYDVTNRSSNLLRRGNSQRQGWLAKALVEYKMDWGTPGIFGWYASGDDGSVKNGSERMPAISPCGNFTSFLGDGNLGWARQDYMLNYAGTWGIGLQLRDMSFLEDLSHTFRVAYWGGTNNTSMVKYMNNAYAWNDGYGFEGPYLTTNDGLVEFNLVNSYQIYENLEMNLELDYVINCMDNGTWRRSAYNNGSFSKQDMWKAQVVFAYTF